VDVFAAVIEPALQLGDCQKAKRMIEIGLNVQLFARLCCEMADPIQ
jgi:hypothetical protein